MAAVVLVLFVFGAESNHAQAEEYVKEAAALIEDGEYEQAVERCDQAIELDSEYSTAYYNRALAYYRMGQYEEAVADLDKVIEIDPNDADASSKLAMVYEEMGEDEKAADIDTESSESVNDPLEKPKAEAKILLDQANVALQEVQGIGIDTPDINQAFINASTKYDEGKTAEDYIGESDSCAYWSKVVIDGCKACKQQHAAQQERERQIANCESAAVEYVWGLFGSGAGDVWVADISMNDACTYAEVWMGLTDAQGYPGQGFAVKVESPVSPGIHLKETSASSPFCTTHTVLYPSTCSPSALSLTLALMQMVPRLVTQAVIVTSCPGSGVSGVNSREASARSGGSIYGISRVRAISPTTVGSPAGNLALILIYRTKGNEAIAPEEYISGAFSKISPSTEKESHMLGVTSPIALHPISESLCSVPRS